MERVRIHYNCLKFQTLLIITNFKRQHKIESTVNANSHIPCRAPAVPCRANSHMPFYAPASLLLCRVLRQSSRIAGKKSELPIVKLRVVVGRNRTWANRPQAVDRRPLLIHTYHDVPMPWPWEVACKSAWSEHGRGTVWYVWISLNLYKL
jgi:hypothetical protein